MKIVELQKVKENKDIRLESDFWIKERAQFISVRGADVEAFSQYGTSKELNEDGNGYPVLRLNEFDSFFIHEPAKYCDILDAETYNSLKLKKDDVLICRTNGNPRFVGKAALVPHDYEYAFASYLYRIRPNLDIINSATLVAYLNSKYGRSEIERLSLVGNQANFSPAKFRQIEIPILDQRLQQVISDSINLAYLKLQEAKDAFLRAEDILTKELGFSSWKPSHEQIAILTLQEARTAERIDAEYYQPKYVEISNLIGDYGAITVKDSCKLRDKNFTPNKLIEYKYIELGDIGSYGDILHHTYDYGKSLPSRARRVVHTGDVIISSVEGSLQKCAYITDDYDGALCSTGFYVIYSDVINPETLLVLFKSVPIQSLLKKNCAGAILSSFKKDSLLNMEIPIINSDVQDKIAILIKKSFSLRKESEIIIEASKRSIEIAIEQDVQSAISYMKSTLDGDLLNVSAISQETNYTTSVDDAKDNHVPTINLHIVEENENKTIPLYDEYHEGRIPLYTLRAACGYFEDGEVPEEEGWVDVTGHGFTPDPKRHFVVHAKGNSMLPKIKDGDLCVFEWYNIVGGSREGEIVLNQIRKHDPVFEGPYTIKKYHSEKVVTGEDWQHSKIELIPLNKDFDVIELDGETEYRTIGILKCVL